MACQRGERRRAQCSEGRWSWTSPVFNQEAQHASVTYLKRRTLETGWDGHEAGELGTSR